MKRIGLRMREVEMLVNLEPGRTPLSVVEAMSYRGRTSLQYGYAAVWRTVRAGLVRIEAREDKQGCYRLYPQEEGKV